MPAVAVGHDGVDGDEVRGGAEESAPAPARRLPGGFLGRHGLELREEHLAVVADVLEQAELRRVEARDRHALQRLEELHAGHVGRRRRVAVLRRREQFDLLWRRRVHERRAEALLAPRVDPREPLQEFLAVLRLGLGEHRVDVLVDLRCLRARGVGLRDDQLGQRDHQLVLARIEHLRRPGARARLPGDGRCAAC